MTRPDRLRSLAARVLLLARHKGTLALVDQGIVSSTNFATGLIVGRVLTDDGFGLYGLAFSVATLVLNLQASIIATPLTILLPRTARDERASYMGSTLVHQLCIAGLTAVGLGMVAAAMTAGWGPDSMAGLGNVLGALAAAVTFMLFREYARRVSFANMRMEAVLVLDGAVGALQLGALVLLWQTDRLTASSTFLVAGGACLVGGLGWIMRRGQQFRPTKKRIVPDLKRNFRLGAWVMLYTLAAMVSSEVFPWLLALMHGTDATGRLVAARYVVFLANPLLIGMGNFLGPRTAHARVKGRAELNAVVLRAALFVGACMLALMTVVFILREWLPVFFYEKYTGLGTVVAILALRTFIAAFDAPVNAALLALDRANIVFFSNIVGAIVALRLGVHLIALYGLTGTAWTMVITTSVVVSLRWMGYLHALRRAFPAPRHDNSGERAE